MSEQNNTPKATEVIAKAMGCAYIYDDWGRINLHADKVAKGATLIAETLPTTGTINTQFMPLVSVQKTQIFAFLKHCDLDFNGTDVGAIVDEMTQVAGDFIVRLEKSGATYEPLPTSIDFNAVVDFLDANMAGVRCELTLTEYWNCLEPKANG